MVASKQASAGHDLLEALRGVRRSWWRRALRDTLLVATCTACAALVLAWVQAWRLGRSGSFWADTDALVLTAVAAAVAIVTCLVLAFVRSPSLLDMAHRIDELFDQAERFTTTYEVLLDGGPSNVVSRALFGEVQERARALDAAKAGWPRHGRRLGPITIGAVLVALAVLTVPVPARSGVPNAPSAQAGAHGDMAADAATLAGMAELLDLLAEQEDSDYLAALAASFDELADSVGSRTISADAAERAADELSRHLIAASREVGGAFAQVVQQAFAELPGMSVADLSPAGSEASRGAGADAGSVAAPDGAAVDGSPNPYLSAFEGLLDLFSEDQAAVGLRSTRPSYFGPDSPDFHGGALQQWTDPNAATPMQQAFARTLGPPGDAASGAAERSSDAPGDAAGGGAAELGTGTDAFLDLESGLGPVAELPSNERENGAYIEMELVPQVEPDAAAGASLPSPPPAFARADESAFTSLGIGSEHAGAVSRYFTPDSVPAAGGP